MNFNSKMSEIDKDIGEIWARLFDHRAYLNGEINYTHREFELKRSDQEVEHLFSLLEKVTDIKDTQLNRLKQCAETNVFTINSNLYRALSLCNSIEDTQQKYKEDSSLAVSREDRKIRWQKFMDDMTYKCERVDNTFDEKEEELHEFYVDLERKLQITK